MLPISQHQGCAFVVQASDSAAAKALLTDRISTAEIPAQNEAEAGISCPAMAAPRKKFAPGQIFIGIVAGVLLCLFYQWYGERGEKTHYHYTPDGKADEAWVYRDGHLVEFMRDRNLDGAWIVGRIMKMAK